MPNGSGSVRGSGRNEVLMTLALADVNGLTSNEFVACFGEIAEHSPWVAERAAGARPFVTRDHMIEAFLAAIRDAAAEEQLALLRAHPDLAGRAAIAGTLTADSAREQVGAGLDSLTADEMRRFTNLNTRYRLRFDFPFILAVRGAAKDKVLESFAERIGNDRDTERVNALAQVGRIIRFRIEDRVRA
jgi:2-oxo-4-hydroxy-4-carboxy-5-ureidoimidazoline decarboxylase